MDLLWFWSGRSGSRRVKLTHSKIEKREEISCFEVLNVLGLKAFPEAWTSFMDA
jgi:hypothetical protein